MRVIDQDRPGAQRLQQLIDGNKEEFSRADAKHKRLEAEADDIFDREGFVLMQPKSGG